jgi:hypothetical protein
VKSLNYYNIVTKKHSILLHKNGWLLKEQKTSGDYAVLTFYRRYLEMESAPFWDTNVWKMNFMESVAPSFYFDNNQEKKSTIDLIFK